MWDKKLSEVETKVFEEWAEELQQVKTFALLRQYVITRRRRYQLHVFLDASLDAMCIVAYIRDDCAEEFIVIFAMGKGRIALMRQLSMPRLQLQSAMYATRLRKHIVDEHDLVLSRVFHSTDSVIFLHWLHSSYMRQSVFVVNRVAEILKTSTIAEWKHVQGTTKTADIGTLGLQIKDLEECEWIIGPAWLRDKTHAWPAQPPVFDLHNNNIDIEEAANLASKTSSDEMLVIDWSRFSSWNRLVNTIAFCLKLRTKTRKKSLTNEN